MPKVAFYYPDEVRHAEAARQRALREALRQAANAPPHKPLNFAYAISGPNVAWKPVLAFDDGEHTYLQFPDNTMSTDMPTLMVQNGNQQALVNNQVRGSYYVADRVFHRAPLTAAPTTTPKPPHTPTTTARRTLIRRPPQRRIRRSREACTRAYGQGLFVHCADCRRRAARRGKHHLSMDLDLRHARNRHRIRSSRRRDSARESGREGLGDADRGAHTDGQQAPRVSTRAAAG